MKLLGVLLFFGPMLIFVESTLIDYYEESCYGSNGFIDSLQPQCPATNQVIYPKDVYTYAKQKATGCPWLSYHGIRNETYCCRYANETEDCGMRYYGLNVGLEHYREFTGSDSGLLQVAWNDTINMCNQSIYFEKTHYMRMTYNCINSSQIGSVCNSSLTGNPLFIWNDGYPSSDGGCSSTSGCRCTIQASGGSTIQIDALDLRFAENETSGDCAQRLFIIDGALDSDIACDDVNLFERRSLYTSSSDTVELRYDNTYNGDSGNFWISLEATDSSETLTITCSQSDVNTEYNCGDNFTIISPFTTTTTTEISPTTTIVDISPTTIDIATYSTSIDIQSSMTTDTHANTVSQTTVITDTLSLVTTEITDTMSSTSSMTLQSDLTPSSSTSYTSTSSSTASANRQTSSEDSSSSSKGPIIGIIVGVVVAAVAGSLIAYGVYRRKCRGSYQVEPDDEYENYFGDNDGMITSRPPELPRVSTGFGPFE